MLIKILLAIAVLVVVFVIVVALQPSRFRIARTALISAPPPTVFAQVNDLHKWSAWNPFARMDPVISESYEGAPSGVGAIYDWAGNKAGAGRMTITESRPPELVRLRLEFKKPFEVTNTAEFTFQPQGDGTAVTWAMEGQRNFFFKAFGLFMNMDKVVGGEFANGLAQMKVVAEAAAKP